MWNQREDSPTTEMLSRDYLDARRALIDHGVARDSPTHAAMYAPATPTEAGDPVCH
eukprot:SAG31_NODE_42017_length_273_cov_0.896552_2_plen_55_part_01